MSKLIVEMEMPQTCAECPIGDYFHTNCPLQDDNKSYEQFQAYKKNERPSWCPIVGVLPEQHGRLGDLDRLANMVNGLRIDSMLKGSDTNPYWLLADIIAEAKTIVPAERKD